MMFSPRACLLTVLWLPWVAQSQTANPARGAQLLADRMTGNCVACHALPGQTGVISTFGPSLAKVALKYDEATLSQWVTDARAIKPDTLMPPFGTVSGTHQSAKMQAVLSASDIADVVAALQNFK
jgi:sulfur-oxidizing protein SoxX